MPGDQQTPFVPGWVDDAGLSEFQARLYLHIVRRAGREGSFFESVPNCAKFLGWCIPVTRRTIHELVAMGLIAQEESINGKVRTYKLAYPSNRIEGVSGVAGVSGIEGVNGSDPANGNEVAPPMALGQSPPTALQPKVIPLRQSKEGDGTAPLSAARPVKKIRELWQIRDDLRTAKERRDKLLNMEQTGAVPQKLKAAKKAVSRFQEELDDNLCSVGQTTN